ncbi:transcription antitermination factor NusB [Rhodospirillum rubrum]|uniref:Transcription antitermination protein NusB n=1 Tax=Rhodospirillum rubrum (strain ATCC 11170 / ATH 1.1.1 / DSM 467 / LMG 4362 / NCIMB 8255 / S1) TaxID=269796 RepID=NUSB_RHORT|nr:transcription antitermination factor NusB [Rhodospirillum rubrum]Q2RTC4.1 RecName: Full=Transcription antitermination protein NusB; AltName: Full=Antitermination factor NusB [Rhodospirillum rubrum ATCC 11170]ABC22621.1 NusB antitermination factor [Rhodospirillum rubrum ATCC 11170]AEO48339.1 NusB antitermination factor [Rhodospirillum rubrum F11]MBK5954209.1 N utilization substance protein B [Rhodospirillum rubrum]QXG82244.1 transcription antitermination factor NusB [Rhodospirillum rubrum]H
MALQDDKPGSAPKERSGRQIRSSAARLAAVQALYVLDLAEDARVDQVVLDFMSGSMGGMAIVEVADPEGIFDPTEEIAALEPPDGELFAMLVRGAHAELARLDEVIGASLSADWPWDRLEPVVRAVLRAGVYELLERQRTPPRVAIKEYVDIAAAFYSGAEPGMVNAVLDRVARSARPEAFGGGV